MMIISYVKSLRKLESESAKKLRYDLMVIDKYLGTILLYFSCMVLGCSILQWNGLLFTDFLAAAGLGILLIYISSAVVYCIVFICVWLLQAEIRKIRMFLILAVSAPGVIQFWIQCGKPDIPVLKIAEIVLLAGVFYVAGVLTVNRNKPAGCNDLHSLRNDFQYVPELLNSIQSMALRKRIANEVYSYLYGAFKYKRRYYFMTSLSIILPALVTAINSSKILQGNQVSITISVLSMLTVIVTGIMSSMKAKESWIRYRRYLEYSKQEVFSCIMGLGQYSSFEDTVEREVRLAEEMEKLFEREQGEWRTQRTDK